MTILEATCPKCKETFNPSDVSDTVHAVREDGTECGGDAGENFVRYQAHADALGAYHAMVKAFGPGFHPDNDPADYASLPEGYNAYRVYTVTIEADLAGVDVYAEALEALGLA